MFPQKVSSKRRQIDIKIRKKTYIFKLQQSNNKIKNFIILLINLYSPFIYEGNIHQDDYCTVMAAKNISFDDDDVDELIQFNFGRPTHIYTHTLYKYKRKLGGFFFSIFIHIRNV